MMPAPPLVVLAYCCLCLTNVTLTYLYLADTYGRPSDRYKFICYELFFLMRFIYDANVYYQHPASAVEGAIIVVIADFLSLASFAVVTLLFGSDKLEVFIVTFVINIVTSVMTGISLLVGLILTRAPLDISFLRPFDSSTVIAVAVNLLLYPLFQRPTLVIVRWVRDLDRRYLKVLAILMLASMFYTTQALTSMLSLPLATLSATMGIVSVCVIVPFVLVERLSEREARARERIIRECSDVVAHYNGEVQRQLDLLERDHALFSQSEKVLSRLKEGAVDASLLQSIERLETTYRQISFGTFCNQPSLDAVLDSYAKRLSALGVEPLFSAARVESASHSYTIITLALLNVATSKARSERHPEGSVVMLRLRSYGDGLLCHLQTPASWGKLGIREFLHTISPTAVGAVKERIEGSHTTTLVYAKDDEA